MSSLPYTCASLACAACGENRRLRVCLLSWGSAQSHPSHCSLVQGHWLFPQKTRLLGSATEGLPVFFLSPLGRVRILTSVANVRGNKIVLFPQCIVESKSRI